MDNEPHPIDAAAEPAPHADAGDVDDPLFRPVEPENQERFAVEPDPWAHRRGEPRLFAFFWTLYVFVSVAGSVLWLARTGGWMLGGYGPAGRIMLVVVMVGATVLWPMVRLSQTSAGAGSIGALLADVIVVLLPIQMVVWPMTWLAGWPLESVCGLAAVFAVWVALTGGMLSVALGGRALEQARDPRLLWRAVWMGVFLVVGLAGTVVVAMYRGGPVPGWAVMTSPVTGVLALTGTGISGPQQAVSREQWLVIGTLGVIGLGWWVAGVGRAVLTPRGLSA